MLNKLIFVPYMAKVLFQNENIGNDSQGFKKEILIYPMKVVQVDLTTLVKRQFQVLNRNIHDKVLRN